MTESDRVHIGNEQPASYQALIAWSKAAEQEAASAGLDPKLIELVYLRTSQINGCAYCLRAHTRAALDKGETADRLALLPAWRESDYFSQTERAALALAESITSISSTAVADPAYSLAAQTLSSEQFAAVAWLVTVMNSFNRVAVTSGYQVAP